MGREVQESTDERWGRVRWDTVGITKRFTRSLCDSDKQTRNCQLRSCNWKGSPGTPFERNWSLTMITTWYIPAWNRLVSHGSSTRRIHMRVFFIFTTSVASLKWFQAWHLPTYAFLTLSISEKSCRMIMARSYLESFAIFFRRGVVEVNMISSPLIPSFSREH